MALTTTEMTETYEAKRVAAIKEAQAEEAAKALAAEEAYEAETIAFAAEVGEAMTDRVLARLASVAKLVDAARAAGCDI